MTPRVFLTAHWRHLAMLNYAIAPEVLRPRVPAGTDLDLWHDRALVSVVGFLFQETKVFGWPVPFHRDFEEVNLRFYVRRRTAGGWRRGVVFIKEIVPRLAIAAAARLVYHENYVALPMRHAAERSAASLAGRVEYGWRHRGRWNSLRVRTMGAAQPAAGDSEAEFITEHYWGYRAGSDGTTLEYQVEHPRWRVWSAEEAALECDVAAVWGDEFAGTLSRPPTSALVAEGSPVVVHRGVRLPAGH